MAARASTLPAGLRPLWASSMPRSAATVRTAGSLSPLRMADGRPIDGRWATAGPASGRSGVVTAMTPIGSPSRSTTTTVSPRSYRSAAGIPERGREPVRDQPGDLDPAASDHPDHARPGDGPARRRPGTPAAGCRPGWPRRSGGRSPPPPPPPAPAPRPRTCRWRRPPAVTSAWRSVRVPVLSKTTPVHLGQPLEHVAAADEDAQRRGPAAPDHHGHRRGQAHGAGAGHQQHRQSAQDGLAPGSRRPATRPGR